MFQEHSALTFEGPVYLERMDEFRRRDPRHLDEGPLIKGYIVLLIGPTGSGKSSFIEALSGNRIRGIAKNQLESVTQEPQGYHLVNVKWRSGDPIYLIDTPGLSDKKLSEVRIFEAIHTWMIHNRVGTVNNILYFDRITDIRMSGSRWRAISTLLQAVHGFDKDSSGISTLSMVHITTMWDTLCSSGHQGKAEGRFEELRATIGEWHTLPNTALYLAKYGNTQLSTLDILAFENLILVRDWPEWNPSIPPTSLSPCYMGCAASPGFASFLFRLLADRIKIGKLQLDVNAADLRLSETDDDIELMDVLLAQRDDIICILKHLKQDRHAPALLALPPSDSGDLLASISIIPTEFNDISTDMTFHSSSTYASEAISLLPSDICEAFDTYSPFYLKDDSASSHRSQSHASLNHFQKDVLDDHPRKSNEVKNARVYTSPSPPLASARINSSPPYSKWLPKSADFRGSLITKKVFNRILTFVWILPLGKPRHH